MNNGHSVKYLYDALGRKHKQEIITLKSTVNVSMGEILPISTDQIKSQRNVHYCDNVIYSGLSRLSMKQIMTDEGYLSYEWYHTHTLKDHLGNVRVERDDFEVQARRNYYPYGIEYDSEWNGNSDFAYANKELQSSHGLNWYDFGKRSLDIALGSWPTMDPLCEKYYSISPYAYCAGNPMKYVDPDGMDTWTTSDPEEIARFMEAMRARRAGQNSSEAFNYKNWTRVSDDEEGDEEEALFYDDETMMFSTKSGSTWMASYLTGDGRPVIQIGGCPPEKGLNFVNIEFDLLMLWSGIGKAFASLGTKLVGKAAVKEGTSSIFSQIPSKIVKQMKNRGWTKDLIHETVNNPFTKRNAINKATGNPATAYFQKNGSYIVKDNVTNEVIQISNRLDPSWIPDATIINPYIPK